MFVKSLIAKFARVPLVTIVALGLATSFASADPARGQKLYLKFMKDATGIKGDAFSAQHTTPAIVKAVLNKGVLSAEPSLIRLAQTSP